jgi:ferredoxin-type protein NapH
MKWKGFQTISRHKWRYIMMVLGFLLLVGPFAYLIKASNFLQGSAANADLHKACFRMTFDWIASGRFATFDGRYFLIFFTVGVLMTSFFLGPLFCGWLCPVGSSTEVLSRQVPKKAKIDLSKKFNPSALRYGFFASFLVISALAVFAPSLGLVSICCRYCASSQLQNLISGIFDPAGLQYWHSGSIMTVGGWLVVGGVFWKGGRGWCLYACPLGAASNLFYKIGAKLSFTKRIKHSSSKCIECHKCEDVCPSWAITCNSKDVKINQDTCTACLECVKNCPTECFEYGKK